MLLRILKKEEKGVVTIEASIILVIFISAYIALLSFFGIYKAYTIVQNALNQSAKELAQYSYILKIMELEDIGKDRKNREKRATAFTEKNEDTVKAISHFISSTDSKEKIEDLNKIGDYYFTYIMKPKDLIDEIVNKEIHLRATDEVKRNFTHPKTQLLMNKYLGIYSNEDFKNLGIVNGKDGISYMGSDMFVRGSDIRLVANYKYKIKLPFLDTFEIDIRNKAITRAWVGDKTIED